LALHLPPDHVRHRDAVAQQRRRASVAEDARNRLGGEKARVFRGIRVDRVDHRDVVPLRDAHRRPREGEKGIRGMNEIVSGERAGEGRVPGREIGVVGNVREESQSRGRENRPFRHEADIVAEHGLASFVVEEMDRQIDLIGMVERRPRQTLPAFDVPTGAAMPHQAHQHADPQPPSRRSGGGRPGGGLAGDAV
jgi:hypothetical protein